MKNTHLTAGIFTSIVDLKHKRIKIRLAQPRMVRLVTRSLLLTVLVLSLPFVIAGAGSTSAIVITSAGSAGGSGTAPAAAGTAPAAAGTAPAAPLLSEIIGDLCSRGLHSIGSRAIFLGDPSAELGFLIQNRINPVTDEQKSAIADNTVDFLLAAGLQPDTFSLIDRTLKLGGIAAIRLGSSPADIFRVPPSYRIVYARRFGSNFAIALKKVMVAYSSNEHMWTRRRLMGVPDAKKEALNGLEEVALEPPAKGRRHRRTMYLPDLMGDSLAGYTRRVFVDVGSPGRAGSSGWFEQHYPTRHRDFEIIRVDVVAEAAAEDGGMAEWLVKNVREEEYVVVKAEAEVVEEMVKGRALALVDELFLECSNQWEKGKKGVKSRRAYWECLALYGKLRDEGVAVHQWWG